MKHARYGVFLLSIAYVFIRPAGMLVRAAADTLITI